MDATLSPIQVTRSAPRVIVVEDNVDLLDDLVFQLDEAGFFVRGATDGIKMDSLLEMEAANVVVLDVNLPFESGFQIAQRLRNNGLLGIIMHTARNQLDDKLRGLENGADVYLVKPIDRRELIGCINSLWRRINPVAQEVCWQLDSRMRILIAPDGKKLCLTPQDIKIIQLLHIRPSEIFSRKQIVQALGIEYLSTPDARINMMVSRLRQKLNDFDASLTIQTWRNEGYSYVGPQLN
jgi:DNA-binding response OmpR family regulator